MSPADIGNLVVRIGVEPAIIAALLYLLYKLMTDHAKALTENTCELAANTAALEKVADYVRGRNDA